MDMTARETQRMRLGATLGWWGRARDGTAQQPATAEGLRIRYLQVVHRYVSRRISGAAEAEDVTADTFAAAFGALGKCPPLLPMGTPGDDPAKAWVLSIARRKVADVYRRQGRRRGDLPLHDLEDSALPSTLVSGDPEKAALKTERVSVVRQILAELPEPQREALVLKYGEGLSQIEIAGVMGRSAAAVNSLLQRARAAFWERGHSYFEGENGRNTL